MLTFSDTRPTYIESIDNNGNILGKKLLKLTTITRLQELGYGASDYLNDYIGNFNPRDEYWRDFPKELKWFTKKEYDNGANSFCFVHDIYVHPVFDKAEWGFMQDQIEQDKKRKRTSRSFSASTQNRSTRKTY